ncbi:GNAT family N-acetyltransferase [Nocardioides sp.]|uniref:GNAT family N-acetyltransferase n=1 Tax=Nocardioides sp. TaxID=35761 RepID=UPI003569BF7B
MTRTADLPPGLTQRPLTTDDAAALAALITAQELHDVGVADADEADILADWKQPSFDLSSRTLGVFDGDRLVAFGELCGGGHADTAVLPERRGRGIGSAIAGWLVDSARDHGWPEVGMSVPQGGAGDRLLADLGFDLRWEAWDLALPPGAEIEARPLPAGFALRDSTEADHRAVWTLVEDAFGEFADRPRAELDDFGARVWGRPGFEPWNLRLVTDPDGELVGVTNVVLSGDVGFVQRIAVRRDLRGRGLAAAMLADAFALARSHGATNSGLSTDSRTGALGLYEKVGMQVASTWVNRSRTL